MNLNGNTLIASTAGGTFTLVADTNSERIKWLLQHAHLARCVALNHALKCDGCVYGAPPCERGTYLLTLFPLFVSSAIELATGHPEPFADRLNNHATELKEIFAAQKAGQEVTP